MFVAICTDVTQPTNPVEEVMISLSNRHIPEEDRKLIEAGAVFDWKIFDDKTATIHFARQAPLSNEEVQVIQAQADEITGILERE